MTKNHKNSHFSSWEKPRQGKSDNWESTISKYLVCPHNILITDTTDSGDPDPNTAAVPEQAEFMYRPG